MKHSPSIEGSLTHSRLTEMTNEHPHDLSKTLHELVDKAMLESDGAGRGTYYFLPRCHPVDDGALSINNEPDNTSFLHKDSEVAHKELYEINLNSIELVVKLIHHLGHGKTTNRTCWTFKPS